MSYSKCTLSPLCGHAFRCCVFEFTTTRVSSDHTSHTFCSFFCVFETVLFFVVCGGLVFPFLCCTLLLQCFLKHLRSIQDVSKWNTGAVTTMMPKVSVLSLSLSVATPSAVVYFEYTTTRVSSNHNSHTCCCFCVFDTVPFVVVCGGLVTAFSLLNLSCSVHEQRFQTNTVRWQMGIFVWKQLSRKLFNIHRSFRMLSPRYIYEFVDINSV